MIGPILRSSLAIALSALAVFALFHLVAFPLFRNSAHLGPSRQNIEELRAIFLVLFTVLIATSFGAGLMAGRFARASWVHILLLAVPLVVTIGFFSFFFLEFQNACEIDDSLFVDSRC